MRECTDVWGWGVAVGAGDGRAEGKGVSESGADSLLSLEPHGAHLDPAIMTCAEIRSWMLN